MGTNCWIVAPAAGEDCVIIDPGLGVAPRVDEILAENRLRPVAVLLTHGHFDHTFSVVPVCGAKGVPAYIHPSDRGQLADPWTPLNILVGTPLFGEHYFGEPDDVRELVDGEPLHLAGLELTVALAPGHTPGSIVFGLDDDAEPPQLFSGDFLFAGSIGRMDLPGGSEAAMLDSLVRVALPLPDATVVRPGHGPDTTIARERVSNPYLRQAAAHATEAPVPRAPRTGL
jgi:glyoxylase-like metal-dependent hydrolase (beta-lactamase superfamily II)